MQRLAWKVERRARQRFGFSETLTAYTVTFHTNGRLSFNAERNYGWPQIPAWKVDDSAVLAAFSITRPPRLCRPQYVMFQTKI